MAVDQPLAGVFVPAVTPFREDLSPDARLFVCFCWWLVGQGAGLAVFGTNSEANSLSTPEKLRLLEALGEAGLPGARLMPGTGATAIPDSVELSKAAVALGAAGTLMLPPFYYKGNSDEGLFRFYAEVIERVGDRRLKILLYHIPQISGVPITLGLIEMLVKRYPDSVVGIKDSSGDWDNTKAVIDAFPGFRVFPGSEVFLRDGLAAGGAGCISATANIDPAGIGSMFAARPGEERDAIHEKLVRQRRSMDGKPMIPSLKAVIAHHGRVPGFARVRPPFLPLPQQDVDKLINVLAGLGFSAPGLDDALSAARAG